MKKIALITGISGQDGSYLANFLLKKNYKIIGTDRRSSRDDRWRLRYFGIENKIIIEDMDLSEITQMIRVFNKYKIDEVYNLGAQSFVASSFSNPVTTCDITGIGSLRLLEVIRNLSYKTKFYQASSSEMFGNSIDQDGFQRESTSMNPVSPYGCAKVFSYNICRNYRNSYGMYISNGILFNHESPRRGTNFVTNKVCKEAVKIKLGLSNKLALGNLDATRDWGHAKDYVEAMWLILQRESPEDYVCSTGVSHSVKDLVEYVFGKLDLDWKDYVVQDEKFLRPEELDDLKGDSRKLRSLTGWSPKYTFETMLDEMIEHWLSYYSSK